MLGKKTGIIDDKPKNELVSMELWKAYSLLAGIDDPVVQHTRKHIWRRIWAIENLQEWFQKLTDEPKFAKILYQAIPYDDVELLQEIKSIANNADESSSSFIVGLINERLERCRVPSLGDTRLQEGMAFQATFQNRPTVNKRNYQGFVCAIVEDPHGKRIAGSAELPALTTVLPIKAKCRLAIWMQPDKPIGPWADDVQIETGIDEDLVDFSFELDCATLPIPYGRKRVRFPRNQKSDAVFFDFYTESEPEEHLIFVHVLQERRLVKSLMVVLQVSKRSNLKKNAQTRLRKA
jgi:hypothetical protein